MKYSNAYNIIKNIKDDLDKVYEPSGHPTKEDISYLEERNYNINTFSYYDGKLLYARTTEVIIGAIKYMGEKRFTFIDKNIFPYEILIIEHFNEERYRHFNSDPLNGSDSYYILQRNEDDINYDDYIVLDTSLITEDMKELIDKLTVLFNKGKDLSYVKYLVRLVKNQ